MTDRASMIVVSSNRRWVGSPRMGSMAVSVDGKRVGHVAPVDRLEVPCVPGTHIVRVRQGHLRSGPIEVEVPAGSLVTVEVGDPSQRPFLKLWLTSMVAPGSSVSLSVSSSHGEKVSQLRSADSLAIRNANKLGRRKVLLSGVFQLLGFALLVVAIAASVPILLVPAIAFVVVGLWLAIRLFSRENRSRQ